METDWNQPVCNRGEHIHHAEAFLIAYVLDLQSATEPSSPGYQHLANYWVLFTHCTAKPLLLCMLRLCGCQCHSSIPAQFTWTWTAFMLVSPSPVFTSTIGFLIPPAHLWFWNFWKYWHCEMFPCRSTEVGSINTLIGLPDKCIPSDIGERSLPESPDIHSVAGKVLFEAAGNSSEQKRVFWGAISVL